MRTILTLLVLCLLAPGVHAARGVTIEDTDAEFRVRVEQQRIEALQGNAAALHGLGNVYFFGMGPYARNETEATIWYRWAAELDFAHSQLRLGLMFSDGSGVSDSVRAYKWLTLASSNGDRNQSAFIDARRARESLQARMTSQELAEAKRTAMEWLESLCRYRHSPAGSRPRASFAQACRKAATQRDAESQYELAMMFHEEQNPDETRRWLYFAAEQGHASAQYKLGIDAYHRRNHELAYLWLTRADSNGHPEARRSRDRLERQMRERSVEMKKDWEKKWRPKGTVWR